MTLSAKERAILRVDMPELDHPPTEAERGQRLQVLRKALRLVRKAARAREQAHDDALARAQEQQTALGELEAGAQRLLAWIARETNRGPVQGDEGDEA